MSTSPASLEPLATDVTVSDERLSVVLSDGREVSAPLAWFPRLLNATPEQRKDWRLIGGGVGIGWRSVDEHVSVAGLLATAR